MFKFWHLSRKQAHGRICLRLFVTVFHLAGPINDLIHVRTFHIAHAFTSTISLIFVGNMMTSSNGNIFRVTGHMYGEFPGPQGIPLT